MTASPKISLEGVRKSFFGRAQNVLAIERVDLTMAEGEFVALVGPSGCGKSTALNMVAGLIEPSDGRVLYDDQPIAGYNLRVGYMTQKDTLFPWRTVTQNVGMALELKCRSVPRDEKRERVRQIVELVGLAGFENHYPAELSGGMRKRVALARTLIYEPETLLMDEPFGALDAQLKLLMQDEFLRITQLRRMTVLFVTHDLGEAISLADRVAVFSARPGRIRAMRDIPLPRPRDVFHMRFTPEFGELYEDLWNELKDEVVKGTENRGATA
jgi:NitT/TauT family transport system ATP-binding protein